MSDRRHREYTEVSSILRRNTAAFRPLASSLAIVLLWLSATPATHAAAFTTDAEIAYTTDDNVTRAQYSADILKDQFISVTAGVNYLQWLNTNNRVIYRGFLRADEFSKYDKLSNVTAGVNVTYQYRESGAFLAPLYGIFFKSAIDEYKSNLRDSNLYSVGVSWRKPITDRISTTAVLSGNMRDSDSVVFDTKEVSLLLNGDYMLGSRWTVYLTYNYLKGDIVSTSVYTTSPRLNFVDNAEVINADDAFASGAVAYRLNAQTNVVALGTNFKLAEKHSLDLSARYVTSHAAAGITYERTQFSLAYLARF